MRGREVNDAAERSAPDDVPDCAGCDEAAEEVTFNPGIIFGKPKRSGSCRAKQTVSTTHQSHIGHTHLHIPIQP